MNVASIELCKELYSLSKWNLTEKHWYKGKSVHNAPYGWDCPAYDLRFLLEKLPPQVVLKKEYEASPELPEETPAHYRALYDTSDGEHFWLGAETPEDAAAKLTIELFKHGLLKRRESVVSHSTWEEKIESLVKLAKAVGRFINTDRGTQGYNVTREHLLRAYDEFCEWRHDEPYLVDEIKALMQSVERTQQNESH